MELEGRDAMLHTCETYSCNVSLSGQYMAVKSTTNRCILLNGSLDVTPEILRAEEEAAREIEAGIWSNIQ
jgi:hypothetical protein